MGEEKYIKMIWMLEEERLRECVRYAGHFVWEVPLVEGYIEE